MFLGVSKRGRGFTAVGVVGRRVQSRGVLNIPIQLVDRVAKGIWSGRVVPPYLQSHVTLRSAPDNMHS